MRYLIKTALVGVLLVGCRQTDKLVSVTTCGDICIPQGKTKPLGVCSYGVVFCAEDGGTKCVSKNGPREEICDGLDNDCNGQTDELSDCCVKPTPEICDGRDNDCNGKVDDLPTTVSYCYGAPQETLLYGDCRPGVTRCVDGKEVCHGRTLPTSEICDGKDNDCDGAVDEGFVDTTNIDIVMVFDNSGSMGGYVSSLVSAISSFSTHYGADTTIQWALVTAPDNDSKIVIPHMFQNFGSATQLSAAIAQQGSSGAADEPTLDALYEICLDSNPLGLNWASKSRKNIILFTDEEPQSWVDSVGVDDVEKACIAAGVTVSIYGTNNYQGWIQIAKNTGGMYNDIVLQSTRSTLENVIKKITCR